MPADKPTIYCMDTGALIAAWNMWYKLEKLPGFWSLFESLAADGRIIVPAAVLFELQGTGSKGKDPLYRWVKAREAGVVVSETRGIQEIQTRLCQDHSGFGGSQIPGERDYADPWVVATAIASGEDTWVICDERERKGSEKFRIPDVCNKEDVRHSRVYRLINDSDVVFTTR